MISTARVATDRAPRYAKQLASHLGRMTEVEELGTQGYRFTYDDTVYTLTAGDEHLLMEVTAPDENALAEGEELLGSHLEQFATRDALTAAWTRAGSHPSPRTQEESR